MGPALREWSRPDRCHSSAKCSRSSMCLFLSLIVVILLVGSNYSSSFLVLRGLQHQSQLYATEYDQSSLMKTVPYLENYMPKLLVFDGIVFQVFNLAYKGLQYTTEGLTKDNFHETIPLLVHALSTNFPNRFKPGSSPFELLLSDSSQSSCVNKRCPVDQFSPILVFGSTPRDGSRFPTMQSFPNSVFTFCLYQHQIQGSRESCKLAQDVTTDIPWESLNETIIWRGSDRPFLSFHQRFRFNGPTLALNRMTTNEWANGTKEIILDDLTMGLYQHFTPQWRASLMSIRAESEDTPWIDARFLTGENSKIRSYLSNRGIHVTGENMSKAEMSRYKYQLDLGGDGGTACEATLTKLMMPGVLFHQETESKDWFFDLMKPWQHYIPIKWDLSNLRSRFLLAQANQARMQSISAAATNLVQYMLTPSYMERVYHELFVDYLGKVVNSYQAPMEGTSWSGMKDKYKKNGFDMHLIGICKQGVCKLDGTGEQKIEIPYIKNAQLRKGDTTSEAAGAMAEVNHLNPQLSPMMNSLATQLPVADEMRDFVHYQVAPKPAKGSNEVDYSPVHPATNTYFISAQLQTATK